MALARFVPALVAMAACVTTAPASDRRAIRPGLATIGAAERAIVPDPARGVEHAVILVDETLRDEASNVFAHHLRALILDNEARDLGNIKLPFDPGKTRLSEFWARTILPDGRVLELKKSDLVEQSLVKTAFLEYRSLAAAMPGIVPGAVIDYGYVFKHGRDTQPSTTRIQQPYPIRDYYLAWSPAGYGQHGFTLTLADRLPVRFNRDAKGIVITGKDIPAAPSEPLMPPLNEAVPVVSHVVGVAGDAKTFWEELGTAGARFLETLDADATAYGAVVKRIPFPDGADLETRLRTAYEWLQANVVSTDTVAAEPDDTRDRGGPLIDALLRRRRGSGFEIALAYIGIARQLGAQADGVLVPDRRYGYWNQSVLDYRQLRAFVVALRDGGDKGAPQRFVAPGSGLPFGVLPWWVSGGLEGLLLRKTGAHAVMLGITPSGVNGSEVHATLCLDAGSEEPTASWSHRFRGQSGYETWLALRATAPEDLTRHLEDLCAAGASLDVTHSASPGLEQPSSNLRLECAVRLQNEAGEPLATERRVRFDGPWMPSVPRLSGATRTLPVIFPYVFTEEVFVDVGAPPGFEPAEAPEPVERKSAFGTYRLKITTGDDAFHVERSFSIDRIRIETSEYAELVRFLDDVRRGDATALVFRLAGQ